MDSAVLVTMHPRAVLCVAPPGAVTELALIAHCCCTQGHRGPTRKPLAPRLLAGASRTHLVAWSAPDRKGTSKSLSGDI